MMKNITPVKGMKFSKIEIEHLFKSWLMISVAFAIFMTRDKLFSMEFIAAIIVAGLTVGIAFIFHELGHKFVAQKFHCKAEYRANFPMLYLMIILSFLGIIFAAPGGVIIQGLITRKQYGKIASAGPLMNILLGVIFFSLIFVTGEGFLKQIVHYGFYINSFLALFNLIPFPAFDGNKILHWNKTAYYSMIIASFILVAFAWNLFKL